MASSAMDGAGGPGTVKPSISYYSPREINFKGLLKVRSVQRLARPTKDG